MKKDILFLSIVFLALCLCPAMALASYSVSQYPYVPPIEKMQQNGAFIIFVEKEGKWQEVGKLTHDEFFRERAIDLSSDISGDEKIRIRIIQKSGGAAHIDSIFLGENPPVEVRDVENGIKKLSKKDFDVLDAYGKNLDMEFPMSKGNNILKLTARVEGTTISKTPFLFPLKNLFKNIDKNAHFYTYRINSLRGNIIMDGVLDETVYWQPLFSEYYPSGSGHPSGFTYGWVWNDDENLYVAIDFTPDNTMDGDKDYAKIYVNTEDELKEFKVSVVDTHWGRPAFTYTNKVGYQHKVYEFKVPFKELLKGSMKSAGELQLAFSAYGTASASRPIIYCDGVVTGQEPTIDGGITWAGEWQNPPHLTIPSSATELLTHFYCKNDSTDLYILVDAVEDQSNDSPCDECLFVFNYADQDWVEVWEKVTGSGTTNGESLPAGATAAIGYSTTINDFANNHRIYEFKIPLISINALPGQMIDFASPSLSKECLSASMPYDGSTGKDNVWPPGLKFYTDIDTWGFLQLADAVLTGTLYLGHEDVESLYAVNATTAATGYIGTGNCEGLAPGTDPSFLYCVNNNDYLYTIATADGTRTPIGSMGPLNNTGDRGLAYNTTTSILYGSDANRFGSINTSNGNYTALANTLGTGTECLAADPNNNLVYGIDGAENLYVYNVVGDSWSLVGPTNPLIGSGEGCGLAFDPTANVLYAVDGFGYLFRIDPTTAATTQIGYTEVEANAYGLAFVNDDLDIPTMTQWGMIIFVVLAGIGALYYLRRQRRVER
jgi:hypothetical protein